MHISKIKVFHDISSSSFKTVQWYHVVYIFVSVVKENHTFLLLLGFVELKRQRARDAPSKLYWAKILFRERERKLKYIYLYGMSSFYKSTYIIKNKEKKKIWDRSFRRKEFGSTTTRVRIRNVWTISMIPYLHISFIASVVRDLYVCVMNLNYSKKICGALWRNEFGKLTIISIKFYEEKYY